MLFGGLERLRLLETNYGRTAGWYIEHDGRRIATLTYLGPGEMFWDWYRLEPEVTNPADDALLDSKEAWRRFVFRSRMCNRTTWGFPAGGEPWPRNEDGTGSVCMRGLYL